MVNAIPGSPRLRSPRGPRQPIDAPVTPRTNPQSSVPGSYIYSAAKEDWSGQTRPTTRPPSRPSSAANIYREPIPAPHPRPASSLNPSPPATQRRSTLERSTSNVTVPGIDVEPPSSSLQSRSLTNSSEGTTVDPVLLTPEHANRPTTLPDVHSSSSHPDEPSGLQERPPNPIIVNQLPPGFVPLSPIPAITNFKPEDHDPRLFEQFKSPGYEIYAGAALIPETRIQFGPGMPLTSGSRADSILFGEPPRPSTAAAATAPSSRAADNSRKRVSSFGNSPAPLNRPFSIFSDD